MIGGPVACKNYTLVPSYFFSFYLIIDSCLQNDTTECCWPGVFFRPSLCSNFAVIKLSFVFFLGLKMPDDFHSTVIVLETFSDICLEDRRSVE